MPRTRFEKLSQYLQADNRKGYIQQDPLCNKLYLVQPTLDIVLERCQVNYHSHRDVSVDETMIKFRGRLGFRHYMPAKPNKYGVKIWVLADSCNNYVSNFEVYVKAKWRENCEVGLGRNVLKRISNQLQGKSQNVYFDNYFNSAQLHKELNEVRMYGCGTVWTNSKVFLKPCELNRVIPGLLS